MPSRKEGRVGSRCSQREALPRHKATAKRPNRLLVVGEESEDQLLVLSKCTGGTCQTVIQICVCMYVCMHELYV